MATVETSAYRVERETVVEYWERRVELIAELDSADSWFGLLFDLVNACKAPDLTKQSKDALWVLLGRIGIRIERAVAEEVNEKVDCWQLDACKAYELLWYQDYLREQAKSLPKKMSELARFLQASVLKLQDALDEKSEKETKVMVASLERYLAVAEELLTCEQVTDEEVDEANCQLNYANRAIQKMGAVKHIKLAGLPRFANRQRHTCSEVLMRGFQSRLDELRAVLAPLLLEVERKEAEARRATKLCQQKPGVLHEQADQAVHTFSPVSFQRKSIVPSPRVWRPALSAPVPVIPDVPPASGRSQRPKPRTAPLPRLAVPRKGHQSFGEPDSVEAALRQGWRIQKESGRQVILTKNGRAITRYHPKAQ